MKMNMGDAILAGPEVAEQFFRGKQNLQQMSY